MSKQLVVILGMHRSGTSLITKSMELVGFSFGNKLMPNREDNPKGFFEDMDVVALNDELLLEASSTWDSPRLSMTGEPIKVARLTKKARRLITSKFKDCDKLVIKDPRMCVLMPFWHRQFDALDINVRYVTVHRNPLDVASSLERRNGLTTRHGLLIDYLYTRALVRFQKGNMFVVDYARFMSDPATEVSRIATYLDEAVDAKALKHFLDDFVDPSLKHFGHSEADLLKSSEMFPALLAISEAMTALAQDHDVDDLQLLESHPDDLRLEHELMILQLGRDLEYQQQSELLEQSLREDIQSLEADFKRMNAEALDKARQLEEREGHVVILQQQIEGSANQLVESNAFIQEQGQRLDLARDQLDQARVRLDQSREQIDQVQAQLLAKTADAEDKLIQLAEREKHIALLQGEIGRFEGQLVASNVVIQERDRELEQSRDLLLAKTADFEDQAGRLAEREKHIATLQGEVRHFESQFAESNRVIRERDQDLEQGRARLIKSDQDLEQANAQLLTVTSNLENNVSVLEEREKHITLLQHEIETIEAQLRDQVETFEAQLLAKTTDLDDKTSQLAEREKHITILQDEVGRFEAQLLESNAIILQRDQAIEQVQNLLVNEQTASEHAREQVEGYQRHMADFDRIHRDVLSSVSYRLGRIITYPLRKPFSRFVLPRLTQNPVPLRVVGFLRRCVSHPVTTLKLMSPRRIRNFYLLMTERQDLVDQVVGNYEQLIAPKELKQETHVHHHSEEELAASQLSLPVSDNPRVSVLIPVYNQIDYTLMCLRSIAENRPDVPFEVVIADDCSTDQTESVLARIEGPKVVRNQENLRFLLSCNRAVDFCRGEYIFLLNNDTTVQPGWLDRLLEVFESHSDAGIVGSKLVYPDGKLQEAGGIVWQDGSAWNYGRLQDADAPEFNYFRETDYVSGAAILFPRQLFLDLGKFDEALAPAYYEDTDLAFKMRSVGKKVYYQPQSVVVHYEGVSHGTDETAGMKQYQVANWEKFEDKWKDVLRLEHFPNGERVSVAREKSRDRTTILVIDHYVPHFDKDAGSRSTFLYLRLLCDAGCNVKFLGDNFYKHEPYTSILQSMGIEVLFGQTYVKGWKSWLRENSEDIDVIYLMRPHIAENYIDFINELAVKPRTIYFGHDLHYLRLERQARLAGDSEIQAEADFWRQREYQLFDKMDLIYYPSEVEVEEIKANRPDLPVKAIPLYAFEEFDTGDISFEERNGLLFVGGFNHPPNADGLTWFIESVLPTVIEKRPGIQLHVVGSNMPKEISDLAGEHVVVHGFLSDEELESLYQQVRMSIVPLRFGAGIKGKVLEAMDRGIPVVTTHVGAEGIPHSSDCLLIAEEADEMVAAVLNTYDDLASLDHYSQAARQVVQQSFSTDAVLDVVADDFKIQRK